MADRTIEVSRVIIKIGGRESELTVDEARKLFAALKELLGENEKPAVVPFPYPYPVVTHPWWYDWQGWRITCGSNTNPDNAPYSGGDVTVTWSVS